MMIFVTHLNWIIATKKNVLHLLMVSSLCKKLIKIGFYFILLGNFRRPRGVWKRKAGFRRTR